MPSSHDIVSHPFTTTFTQAKARRLARRSDFSKSDVHDLQQDMLVHLLEVADQYDPTRGNIEAFVTMIVNSWIAQMLRSRKSEKSGGLQQSKSLDSICMDYDGSETSKAATLLDSDLGRRMQHNTPSGTDLVDQREELAHALSLLPEERRGLVMYVAEHGEHSASMKYGISRRQIRKQMAAVKHIFTFSSQNDQ